MLNFILFLLVVFAGVLAGTEAGHAAEISAQLSSREAYVGASILLQIEIGNVNSHEEPEIPEVPGLKIESAGPPSESSQITIINGRRSQRQSVVFRFRITPLAAGKYTIPAFDIHADGRTYSLEPMEFVAFKSETGDLLFVEIAGKQSEVFVGQPLELTLKIWIKPYRDRQREITLSEADMWQMISEQTSWGSFVDQMQQLAENRQRPSGSEVLRDDGNGDQRSYYLYEITATIYPRKPGKLDTHDVQVVVDYPTALGKSRDPFADFFSQGGFGASPFGNSPMRDEDLFGSPFGNRLAITKSRPIVAAASISTIDVLPIPSEGRPSDYRGAVGRYAIATQANPTKVKAGDPIELTLRIEGTGPMGLVQAPPLSELPQLTQEFKVVEEPLAGISKGSSKIFSTKIRPRDEQVQQIPAIPFSFFDPEKKEFVTVQSEPIAIVVEPADSLVLDTIAATPAANPEQTTADAAQGDPSFFALPNPKYDNYSSFQLVDFRQRHRWSELRWVGLILGPPLLFLVFLIGKYHASIRRYLARCRSAKACCLAEIQAGETAEDLQAAIAEFVFRKTHSQGSSWEDALGEVRRTGAYPLAASFESLFSTGRIIGLNPMEMPAELEICSLRKQSLELIEKFDSQISGREQPRILSPDSRSGLVAERFTRIARIIIWAAIGMGYWSVHCGASEGVASSGLQTPLNQAQREQIFQEANALYAQALASPNDLRSQESFKTAASQYQLLVDSGVLSAELLLNLANAYYKSEDYGYAIAYYRRAQEIDPLNAQVTANLIAALTAAGVSEDKWSDSMNARSGGNIVRAILQRIDQRAGLHLVNWISGAAWISLWFLLILRLWYRQLPVWGVTGFLAIILTLGVSYQGYDRFQTKRTANAVLVPKQVTLRDGDGESFAEMGKIEPATGRSVWMMGRRAGWVQIRTASGQIGWVPAESVVTATNAPNLSL